jgi:choline dehydrogenase-like flavoprotein
VHDDTGGRVSVDGAGRVKLHYPFGPALREAAADALVTMARIQLAAGAREVMSLHDTPIVVRGEADLGRLAEAPFQAGGHTLFSAHQMGGCPMGDDPGRSVVDGRGRHHELENVWIVDGSIFPTGLGVNPQLSIFGCAHLFATEIAKAS